MKSRHLLRALAVAGVSLLALGVWAFGGALQKIDPRADAATTSPAFAAVSSPASSAGAATPAASAFGADPLQVASRACRTQAERPAWWK